MRQVGPDSHLLQLVHQTASVTLDLRQIKKQRAKQCGGGGVGGGSGRGTGGDGGGGGGDGGGGGCDDGEGGGCVAKIVVGQKHKNTKTQLTHEN